VAEVFVLHQGMENKAALRQAVQALAEVGIPEPDLQAARYPHQLSGGMRQRVLIAIALACGPALLIADEPTTALDVTVQAQILDLLSVKKRELGLSLLLITHDFSVVAQMADQVAVMYAGRVVEKGETSEVLRDPRHPYTQALLKCLPRLGERKHRLPNLEGQVPEISSIPDGCAFNPRCPRAFKRCRHEDPRLMESGGRRVACHLYQE
jgi:oligopeptide/dipeptide ABC transporter ATP-binding protein